MPTTLRVSVLVRGTVHDVAVGSAALPEQVLAALALPPAPLRTLDGGLLRAGAPLGEQGVRSGTRLLVDVGTTGSVDPAEDEPASAPAGTDAVRTGLAALGSMLLVGAAAVIAGLSGERRTGLALTLGGVALLAVVGFRGSQRASAVVRMAVPAVGAAAVAAGLVGPAAGQPLLAATAAMVTLAGLASLLRADARLSPGARAETVLLLEMVAGAVLAAASGIALLADAAPRALALLVAGAMLPVLRLLPATVVRVPDEALLDVRDAAVTAWSLGRSGAGSPAPVDPDEVRRRIGRDRSLLDGAVVAVVGTGCTCLGVGLLGSRGSADLVGLLGAAGQVGAVQQVGAGLVALAVVAGLLLTAREVRGLVAKVAMLCGAGIGLVEGGTWLLTFGTSGRAAAAVSGVVLGGIVVVLAVARGRSWRSLRWARLGDLAEATAVALAIPAALVAAGLVDLVRSLVS